MKKNYKIEYTFSSRDDMRNMKKYILENFKYRGYDIHLKPYQTYLFFYIVDEPTQTVTILRVMQNGMDWQFVLKHWLEDNG